MVGVLDGPLPQKLPPTLYARIGDWGFGGLMGLLLLLALLPKLARPTRPERAG